ncbi:DgyrCDS11854 [Dimorphilus gyrociliatus]|uniref:DgyrCDS11854 n=1 Tax=Dimorphilus gyrociliatus TaxID=2664684 RepID=A0A7I8W5L2_9ANNE|nr:DgyrCDS11854 [Dimorphilus gyrociliatus]
MADNIVFSSGSLGWDSNKLEWLNPSKKFELSNTLCIWPDAGPDLWRRTFYTPNGPGTELVKDNAAGLCFTSKDDMLIVETKFKVDAVNQFDQGGIYIRFDHEHWLKTGLEYVDGQHRVSCVVTNEFSDWSTQPWTSGELKIRVFRQKNSYVVEYHNGSEWAFFRIAHIKSGSLEAKASFNLYERIVLVYF